MRIKLNRNYFSIIFIVAIFMGVFHHHNDLKQHNDCKICTIQTNITNADIPTATIYLTNLDIFYEDIISKLVNLHTHKQKNQLQARAPPKIS